MVQAMNHRFQGDCFQGDCCWLRQVKSAVEEALEWLDDNQEADEDEYKDKLKEVGLISWFNICSLKCWFACKLY